MAKTASGGIREQFLSETSGDLRNFKAVGESIVKDMTFIRAYDLSYLRKAAKCKRVDNAIAITLGRPTMLWTVVSLPMLPDVPARGGHVPLSRRRLACADSGPK